MGGNGVNSMGADCRREKLLLPTPKLGKYNNGIIRVFRMTDFNRVVLLSFKFSLEKSFQATIDVESISGTSFDATYDNTYFSVHY